jgi:hypothetical protein
VSLEIITAHENATTSTTPERPPEARQLHDRKEVVDDFLLRLGLKYLADAEALQQRPLKPAPLLLAALLMAMARHLLTTTTGEI